MSQAAKIKENLSKIIKENNHEWVDGIYVDAKTKILIDFKCGHKPHLVTPGNYKNGSGCPFCAKNNSSKSREDFFQKLKDNNHILLSEYLNNLTKVSIGYPCGHEPRWVSPKEYRKGTYNCSECARKKQINKLDKIIKDNNHTWDRVYVNERQKISIDFNCEHGPQHIRASDYIRGNGCKLCKRSKGEKAIHDWLTGQGYEHNVDFGTEYVFKKLPNKFYDFYIPSLKTVFEVHGAQHYKEVDFGTKHQRTLKEEQENDKLKQNFVDSIGVKYIVVDYREGKPDLALRRFVELFERERYNVRNCS